MVYSGCCDPLADCHDYTCLVNINATDVGHSVDAPPHYLGDLLIRHTRQDEVSGKGASDIMEMLSADNSGFRINVLDTSGVSNQIK